jgi:guanosine-3',5'-bis(diphosphate) 3'-pyrophosphohydrolase
MSAIEKAIALALRAHAGQKDKAGQPYIMHPLRVMARVHRPDEPAFAITGVLHDVVEDCEGYSIDTLYLEGFNAEVVDAVNSVTRRDDENYLEFVERAAANRIGKAVKIADIQDNLDPDRIRLLPPDPERTQKYKAALVRLLNQQ